MILSSMTSDEIVKYIVRNDIDRRLSTKVFNDPRFKKLTKQVRGMEKTRNRTYPILFKEPLKVQIDRTDFFALMAVQKKGDPLDFNAYFRVYGERGYIYYTLPCGTGKDPGHYPYKFSEHFQERYLSRCPLEPEGYHFLAYYLLDQPGLGIELPVDPDPEEDIWIPTKTGVMLLKNRTYVSYYYALTEFSEDRQESYRKYYEKYHGDLNIPDPKKLFEFLGSHESYDVEERLEEF